MTRKGIMIVAVAILGGELARQALGAQKISSSVRDVPPTDNAALNGTLACRAFSVSGADTGINTNTTQCLNVRCLRPYATSTFFGSGGYRCNSENTAGYNNDADNQTFYNLVDAEASAGTCNHIAFYSVQGQVASSVIITNTGDDRQLGCPGTAQQNCFYAVNPGVGRATPLTNTAATYGPLPHQIVNISGLSPVPTVHVTAPGGGGCAANEVHLTWEEPETYDPLMRNGVASPVQGVNLYRNDSSCGTCPDGVTGWNFVGAFPMGAGTTGTCVAITGDSWFALAVRVKGPSAGATTLETGRVNGVGFVGANSQCVSLTPTVIRIVSLRARYMGRSRVSVSWTAGTEGGVQGYYVSRASAASGPYARVSEAILPAGDGARYTFSERVLPDVGGVYYRIDIVTGDGAESHSGIAAAIVPPPRAKKREPM